MYSNCLNDDYCATDVKLTKFVASDLWQTSCHYLCHQLSSWSLVTSHHSHYGSCLNDCTRYHALWLALLQRICLILAVEVLLIDLRHLKSVVSVNADECYPWIDMVYQTYDQQGMLHHHKHYRRKRKEGDVQTLIRTILVDHFRHAIHCVCQESVTASYVSHDPSKTVDLQNSTRVWHSRYHRASSRTYRQSISASR